MSILDDLKAKARMPTKKIKDQDRVTVRISITHQTYAAGTESVETVFQQFLDGKEQPFSRKLNIGTAPVELNFGWIDKDEQGLLFIKNNIGEGLQSQPDEAQMAILEDSVITIGTYIGDGDTAQESPFGYVLPGSSVEIQVIPGVRYYVVSRQPNTPIRLFMVNK